MAQTEHLPIYRRSYDLCLYLEQVVRAFPRYQKYSLGADLRDAARRALRLVVRANSRQDKAPILLELRETLEELKVLLRLGQDGNAFRRFNSFAHATALVVDIAKPLPALPRSRTLHRRMADGHGNPHSQTICAGRYEYTVIFEPAQEGGYVVTVPALPGCVTEGDTFEEAEAMAAEAIQGFLEALQKAGEEIPLERGRPFTRRIAVRLSPA